MALEQAGESFYRSEGDHETGARVRENSRLTLRVVLDLVGPEGRIDRNRNSSCEQCAEETREERRFRPKHKRDGVSLPDAAHMKCLGDGDRLAPQLGIGNGVFVPVLMAQEDMRTMRCVACVPVEDLDERRGRVGGGTGGIERWESAR